MGKTIYSENSFFLLLATHPLRMSPQFFSSCIKVVVNKEERINAPDTMTWINYYLI